MSDTTTNAATNSASNAATNALIDVSLDTNASAIHFKENGVPLPNKGNIAVPFTDGLTPFTIELKRETLARWTFKNLLLWSTLNDEALIQIPTGVLHEVYNVEELSFTITDFSDNRILIENVNRNKLIDPYIVIHLEVTIEFNGILYISKDPQVLDQKDPGT
jgi:hypothetical protein